MSIWLVVRISNLQRTSRNLKLLGGNCLFVRLNDCDLVQQPIGTSGVSNIFCAVGEGDLAIDPVAIPVFRTGEVAELGFVECLRRVVHGVAFPLSDLGCIC